MSFLRSIGRFFHRHFVPSPRNGYRPHLLRRPWLLFFLAAILATEGFLVANLVAREDDQTFLAAVVPAEIIALTNEERAANSVGQLADNPELDAAAQAKASDMATENYFSHVGPDGKTPWQWILQFGYHYQYAGENLAVRFVDSQDVVNAWMASPTHRANIVKPVYTDIGVGVAEGDFEGEPATYVVQYFASPEAATASSSSLQSGAAIIAVPPASAQAGFVQSLVRQLIRALADPGLVANWILFTLGFVLIVALSLTFFVHLQIQPTTVLMSGALVAIFAFSFLALNILLVGGAVPQINQAASVGYALFP